jgi:thioredoxin 1
VKQLETRSLKELLLKEVGEMTVKKITVENFSGATEGAGLVLLDFKTEYCAPCVALSSVFERISNEHPDVAFGEVDLDESPQLAARLGVRSLPSIVALRGGEVKKTISGSITEDRILSLIATE